jgi:thioredoxin reductase
MATRSVWMDSEQAHSISALDGNTRVDVAVVGAGIAGMTTAYLLQREGKRVAVLDDNTVGGGMTQRTTAHLTNAIDDRYFEIERIHGKDGARLAAQSHTAAIDRIEAIAATKESIATLSGWMAIFSFRRISLATSSNTNWRQLKGRGLLTLSCFSAGPRLTLKTRLVCASRAKGNSIR